MNGISHLRHVVEQVVRISSAEPVAKIVQPSKWLDIVGLYLHPPENALVLCVDEKSGIQALDRTQPGLPLRARRPRTWTNEYVRNGTQALLAALDVATGRVIGHVKDRRTSVNFLRFMDEVVAAFPHRDLHVVLDNLNIHKNPAARRWLTRHPRVHFHHTPTHASWVNLIEVFFSILGKQGLSHGSITRRMMPFRLSVSVFSATRFCVEFWVALGLSMTPTLLFCQAAFSLMVFPLDPIRKTASWLPVNRFSLIARAVELTSCTPTRKFLTVPRRSPRPLD